jgi:hypothetical protein
MDTTWVDSAYASMALRSEVETHILAFASDSLGLNAADRTRFVASAMAAYDSVTTIHLDSLWNRTLNSVQSHGLLTVAGRVLLDRAYSTFSRPIHGDTTLSYSEAADTLAAVVEDWKSRSWAPNEDTTLGYVLTILDSSFTYWRSTNPLAKRNRTEGAVAAAIAGVATADAVGAIVGTLADKINNLRGEGPDQGEPSEVLPMAVGASVGTAVELATGNPLLAGLSGYLAGEGIKKWLSRP